MDIVDAVIAATAGGAVGVARAELARVLHLAVGRLERGGRASRELARIAEAAARTDADLAEEMELLASEDEQAEAAAQLRESLELTGDDDIDLAATLARLLGRLEEASAPPAPGIVQHITNSSGTVHAPAIVHGDYRIDNP